MRQQVRAVEANNVEQALRNIRSERLETCTDMSYSHADMPYLDAVVEGLVPLQRRGALHHAAQLVDLAILHQRAS